MWRVQSNEIPIQTSIFSSEIPSGPGLSKVLGHRIGPAELQHVFEAALAVDPCRSGGPDRGLIWFTMVS